MKLDETNTYLAKLQNKVDQSSNMNKFPTHLFNSLCKTYDERDYYSVKLKKLNSILSIENFDSRKGRLPRSRIRKRRIPLDTRTTRSKKTLENSVKQLSEPLTQKEPSSGDHETNLHISISSDSSDEDLNHDSDETFIFEVDTDDNSNDDDYEDFIYNNNDINTIEQSSAMKKKPKVTKKSKNAYKTSDTKKRKNIYKAKDISSLISKYRRNDIIDYDSGLEIDDYNEIGEAPSASYLSHQWVYDLRTYDTDGMNFSKKYLVIVTGNCTKLSKLVYNDIESFTEKIAKLHISQVTFIQRGEYTQFYILKGLQRKLHFSLGSKSKKKLLNYCKSNNISYSNYTNRYQVRNDTMFLHNQERINDKSTDQLSTLYTDKMTKLAMVFLPSLISVTEKNGRALHVANLGITDLKVHLCRRMSILGNRGLSLISTRTKKIQISHEALIELGEFLIFMIKEVIPSTSLPNMFQITHDIEHEYLEHFARQLNLHNEEDLKSFNIPAVSLLINDTLNPHTDSLNPINETFDTTLSITIQVPTRSLTSSLKELLQERFPDTVPFCIVCYRRHCIVNLCKYQMKIDNYTNNRHEHATARKKIIHILSHSVFSEIDYVGLFFSKHRNRLIQNKFVNDHGNRIFKDKMAMINEAVDKCGYWSSLLHVFYMFAYMHDVNMEDILGFVLFFAHQCNTTLIIVQGMLDILQNKIVKEENESLYHTLARTCIQNKRKQNNFDVGCGGGGVERFGPSSNHLYTEEEIQKYCIILNHEFALASKNINTSKKLTPFMCFQFYDTLETKILKLKGIGKVRASHLIQLASLLGIIPLQYYVYLPSHLEGGTGKFLKNEFGFSDIKPKDTDTLLERHNTAFMELHNVYGNNFTSNMFENMACILGRSKKHICDVFYYLPWVTKTDRKSKELTEETKIQCTFRIKVYSPKKIELLCKSDDKESVVLT